MSASLQQNVEALLGPRGYLHKPEDLSNYEYDGSIDKARPDLVAFPQSTAEVVALVKLASERGIPITGRGAGTGLSGGAIAREGGLMISFARMNRILEIDLANERAVVEPGVVNLDLTLAVEADGYFYAPDPSSQRACTIGGNVSENSGGPHTLAYGVTTNHVLALEVVLPDGSVLNTSGHDEPGYDLTGLLVGSEGTMALVTKITVRLMRKPEAVKTLLAVFDRTDDAGKTVSEITARAITPVAVEMLDGVLLRMVEESTHAGYPLGRGRRAADRARRLERSRGRTGRAHSRGLPGFAMPANFASRAIIRNGSSYGKAARTRSARWAASLPTTTLRTAWCREPRPSRPCVSSTESASATGSPSATSFTPATATCTR